MTVYVLIYLSGAEIFSQIVTSLVSVAVRIIIPRNDMRKRDLSYSLSCDPWCLMGKVKAGSQAGKKPGVGN